MFGLRRRTDAGGAGASAPVVLSPNGRGRSDEAAEAHHVPAAAALLPLLGAAVASASLATAVHLAVSAGHVPPGVTTPPLSLAGIQAPEYWLFASGLVSTAALLVVIEELHASALAPSLRAAAAAGADGAAAVAELEGMRFRARAAFVGLAILGAVPLEGWGGACSTAHSLASLAFFAGSLSHGFGVLPLLARPALARCALSRARAPVLWGAKAAALASALLAFLPAQWMHPQNAGARSDAHDLNVAGATQWWTVGSLLVYFTLFAADFVLLAA